MGLQGALLLIGAVIVAAVVVSTFDKLRLSRREQDRKTRRSQAEAAAADEADDADTIPAGAQRTPYLDINPGPPLDLDKKSLKSDLDVTTAVANRDSPIYRELESVEQIATAPLNLGPGAGRRRRLSANGEVIDFQSLFPQAHEYGPNPQIDFIIYLPGSGPLLRDRALGIYRQEEYLLERPRQLCGLRYLVGRWSSLEQDGEDAQYSDLALAVQLVDANGPTNESELNAFVQLGLKLADAFNRPMKLSLTVEQALARTVELQHIAQQYDVIASVNIIAESDASFTGPAIAQAARAQGMDFGAMNIFHLKNDNARGCRHLFSMANLYQPGAFDPETIDRFKTSGLTLFMTVPCVSEPVRVFEQMMQTAKGLCESLGGKLTDQDGRALSDEGVSAIQRQIKRIASDISALGISPGSETALRFFGP
jgi:cell division protein ZipA